MDLVVFEGGLWEDSENKAFEGLEVTHMLWELGRQEY